MRSAALRHGFGKGCLGEAGGTSQKKAPFRVPSLIREGSDRLERERRFGAKKKARSATRLQAPACGRSGPFRLQTVWYHKKGRRRVWGNRRFLPHMERSGSPRRSGRHLAMPNALAPKEKGTFSRVVVKQLKPSCICSLAFIIVRTTWQNAMYRSAPFISSTNWNW